MKFNLWSVFIDVSLMAGLLLIGEVMRAKIKFIQKLLIPPSLLAGFMALIFGPNGFKIIPFSKQLPTYAAVLIVLIFAAMPIGDKPTKEQMSGPAIGGMFFNITGIAVLQYGVGMFLTVYVLNYFFKLNPGFGLMMATGFYGGHGTAAAVGAEYASLGWKEASALGYTTATVGIVFGIIFGIIIINWGARKGYTHYVASPKELPEELRTGLIPPEKQTSSGKLTISSISIDPMAFHLTLVLVASIAGYYLSKFLAPFIGGVEIPAFCTALLFGFIVNAILNKTHTSQYIDRNTISRISGTATDFLIVSGVGSLQLGIVVKYAVPLIVVCAAGYLTNWLWFIKVGAKSSPRDWFERNMMVWGHASGVAATGVLLQRVVDPELKSRGIEDSGISDLFNRPIIVALQVVPPILLSSMPIAGAHILTWLCLGFVALMFIISYKLKWWVPSKKAQKYR